MPCDWINPIFNASVSNVDYLKMIKGTTHHIIAIGLICLSACSEPPSQKETESATKPASENSICGVGHSTTIVERIDNSSKSIPVSLWYPINDCTGCGQVTYRDYANEISPHKSEHENMMTYVKMVKNFQELDSSVRIQTLLNKPVEALRCAPNTTRKSPLIMLCGAHPIYHLELAEKLAAQGYVVASFPRQGKQSGEPLSFDRNGSAEFQSDLTTVVTHLKKESFTDANNLYFVTWSFEGMPCLEYARSHKNTKLFVSLDASVGYAYGVDLLTDSTSRGSLDFPIVHCTSPDTGYGKNLDFLTSLQASEKAAVQIIPTFDLHHGGFTSIFSISIPQLVDAPQNPEYLRLLDTVLGELEKVNPT